MSSKSGFTLLELIVVVGIFCILLAIASLNLSNINPKANLEGTVQILVADLKQQQIKAMSGEITSTGNPDNFGIYFSGTKYTLFHGSVYSPVATDNFDVNLDRIQISSTFPLSSLIYKKSSGEIINFQSDKNTITLTQIDNNLTKVITISKYGAIE
jgi:prepilin-type N-terminal cleavage/methylation domain-containing protein